MTKDVSKWEHYALKSNQDERLKNDIPIDNADKVKQDLNVEFYPAFFVVDNKGIIRFRPESAAKFIRQL